MHDPGWPLLASGRDADVFDIGDGLVLRRARDGRSQEREAEVMEHARAHGYPVPAVRELRRAGSDMVMDRVDGPTMIDLIGRRPWTLWRMGNVLAGLHERLHQIDAPPGLRPAPGASGTALLHLDLHPLNVLMTASGPVVIDWPNAARGHPDSDVAYTWLVIGASVVPGSGPRQRLMTAGREAFVSSFLRRFDRARVAAHLRELAEHRVADRNVLDVERAMVWQLVERAERG